MIFNNIPSLENNVLISGSPRSGTTWLGEVLNAEGDFRVIFEPFTAARMKEWKKVAPQQNTYLANEDRFAGKRLMAKVLAGKKDMQWATFVDLGNTDAERVMTKEVRVSQMLGWIQHNFPELKILIIVRDPFSVAFSCAQKGWGDTIATMYLSQQDLVKDVLQERQITLIERADSLFQKNLCRWAIDTYLVLANVRAGANVTSVFYEKLVREPKKEFKRLADFCDVIFTEKMLSGVEAMSSTAVKESVIKASSKKFGKRWESVLTKEDVLFADEVLQAFGLSELYSERNVPSVEQPLDMAVKPLEA